MDKRVNCRMVLMSVATLSTHDKPWVRTMARRVLRAVLTDPVSSLDNGVHPAAAPVAEFAISVLQQYTGHLVHVFRMSCQVEDISFERSLFMLAGDQKGRRNMYLSKGVASERRGVQWKGCN